jgi:hypothetical protein
MNYTSQNSLLPIIINYNTFLIKNNFNYIFKKLDQKKVFN